MLLTIICHCILIFTTITFVSAEQSSTCWLPSANIPDCEFPIENLPYGVYRKAGTMEQFRIGVAIGDFILDLQELLKAGLLDSLNNEIRNAVCQSSLNDLMSLDPLEWHTLREALIVILSNDCTILRDNEALKQRLFLHRKNAEMKVPVIVGDYTDFYTSLNHALNVGKMFRPDNPLFSNFKYLPIAYHGRASSIVISGVDVYRPFGQYPVIEGNSPSFLPSQKLDYEMELGAFVGQGNKIGNLISINNAQNHLFGAVILNDWSARDIQKWEYQPLGPFNGKNFCTSISPWIVTFEALKPYRIKGPPRSKDDPSIPSYLFSEENLALDITVEVWILTSNMRINGQDPVLLSRSNFCDQYWSFEQMLVHHTSSGCNLRPGDLIGSGTISGVEHGTEGCLLELTKGGKSPFQLPDGSERKFLEDGDEIIMKAYSQKGGLPKISFGECRARVLGVKQ